MRALFFCILSAFAIAAYGQQPGVASHGPAAGEPQPDTSGLRLQQLLHSASELQRAGQAQQAATTLQQAEWERQGLRNRLDALQAEVERIRQIVGSKPQVLVRLQIFEVSLTKLQKLGFDVSKLPGNSAPAPDAVAKNGAAAMPSGVMDGREAKLFFEALRKDNLVRVLAEPTLVTISGQTATFQSGGKIPVPTPTKDNPLQVEYQSYGTEVQLFPEMLDNHAMRLAIQCRISELDYSSGTHIGKDTVPGFRTRDFTTHTELQIGQALLISGPTQSRVEAENSGVPVLSEVPYAGAMFRSVKERHNEIALFVLVQPEIVEPVAAPAKPVNIPATATRPGEADVRVMAGRAGSIVPAAAPRPGDNSGRR